MTFELKRVDGKEIVIVSCAKCGKIYRLNEEKFSNPYFIFNCPNCGHRIFLP